MQILLAKHHHGHGPLVSAYVLRMLLALWWSTVACMANAALSVGYRIDPSGQQTIQQVRELSHNDFAAFDVRAPISMPKYSVVWLSIQLDNPSPNAQHWVMEFRNPRIPKIEVFPAGKDSPTQQTGMHFPTNQQPISHRFSAVPLAVEANSAPLIYLRVELASRADLSLTPWSQHDFDRYQLEDQSRQAAYFGMALGLLIFNCLLGLALRDRLYIYYAGFVVGMVTNIAATTGFGRLFLWPHSVWWNTYGNLVAALIASWFLCEFLIRLLNLRTITPKAANLFIWNQHLQVVAITTLIVVGEPLYLPILALPVLSVFVALFVIGNATYRGAQGAGLVLIAFAALIGGTVLNIGWTFGLVADNVWSRNGPQIGSALEMLLLSLSLADRFVRMQKEKLAAERHARQAQTEALEAERARVEALQESERLLESRVLARTQELNDALTHLQQAQADLIQAEKLSALGSMVAGVSHELNTPIGVVVTAASALHERSLQLHSSFSSGQITKSKAQSDLQEIAVASDLIHRSAERAATLVRSFKEVAVDQVSERKRTFNLHQVVEENMVAVRASLAVEHWPVKNEVPRDLGCESFPGPLGQILSNLVINAMRHAFINQPVGKIEIGARQLSGVITLWVKDDGCGMDSRTLARVFEPFFTTQLGHGGSGLGLAVSHRIATTLLQGDLRVESQPGQGSTFTLTFAQHSTLGA